MNKQETFIVVLLFAGLVGWTFMTAKNAQPPQYEDNVPGITNEVSIAGSEAVKSAPREMQAEDLPEPKAGNLPVPSDEPKTVRKPEQRVVISNDVISVVLSSWGGGIVSVGLSDYLADNHSDSDPVVLDFLKSPALAMYGIPGITKDDDFDISVRDSGKCAVVQCVTAGKLKLQRTIEIGDNYSIRVLDVLINESGAAVEVPRYDVGIGPMKAIETQASTRGNVSYLDVNTLASAGGEDVVYWGKKGDGVDPSIIDRFQPADRQSGFAMFKPKLREPLPRIMPSMEKTKGTDWVAVKNKFFVQILAPREEGVGFVINAERNVGEDEDAGNSRTWPKTAVIEALSAKMSFPSIELQPGGAIEREMNYFVGPNKHSELKNLGKYQDRVLFRTWKGWGWFRVVCVWMIAGLNGIYKVFPNYGVAIIILTIIIKVIFWPIMQKSNDSMKKMQTLKPEMDALKEKYKNNQQKFQQEQMLLYKKHKINPLASCLPMMIQMPVFIAMFTVIRQAVELRFAKFLWIADLSEPERLFDGMIPLVGSLNILPLIMTATMVWQQKMTPSTGDAQQKQMMVIMPVMMLFLLYNMASGLTLYWTVSQVLSIAQLYMQNKKKAKSEAVS